MNNVQLAAPTASHDELEADPHGVFRRHRHHTPFVVRGDGLVIILRARDLTELVLDTRTRQVETEILALRGVKSGPVYDFVSQSMLFSNGEVHARRRAPMSRAFGFRLTNELRPRVRSLAEELLNTLEADGQMEVRDAFAAAVPAHTIAAVLGIRSVDVPVFTRLVYTLSKALGSSWTAAELPDMDAAAAALRDYTDCLVAERRRRPGGDFLSAYVARIDAEDGEICAEEAIVQLMTVILAGSDTTRGTLTILLSLLLQHDGSWASLRRNPALIPAAIDEAMRYEPAVASYGRLALTDIPLGDHVIPAGSPMAMSTMSGMRDESLFDRPDTFDIARTDRQRWHLIFGGGAHRCLGEGLARIELVESLSALLHRFPVLRMIGPPPSIAGYGGIRTVGPLHVAWE